MFSLCTNKSFFLLPSLSFISRKLSFEKITKFSPIFLQKFSNSYLNLISFSLEFLYKHLKPTNFLDV